MGPPLRVHVTSALYHGPARRTLRPGTAGGDPDLWQARITQDSRFYFTIDGDLYTLHKLQPHPK